MPKPVPKEQQALILAIIVGMILLLGYHSLLLKPKLLRFKEAGRALTKMKGELREAQIDIGNMENLKRQLTDLEGKVTLYKNRISDERKIPELLGELSGLAVSSQVKIVRIEPQVDMQVDMKASAPPHPYKKASISINAQAGYHSLGRFLAHLEGGERLVKIQDLEIRANSQNVSEHDIRLLVDVFVTK